ncbi:MAG TPA: 3-hydroxyacyl-CoA dehydrogenase NAD-binding domain-containing protein [Rhodanobacteraceae bacterium]|nr:3-hydroxyacyl-CoA dehydrogenase NAD-binding domain-containing protein [Rhodanobacteraceae bacterium]
MFEGLRFRHWRVECDAEGILVLTLDRADATVNAINRAVLDEFSEIIERISFDPPTGLVIRSGKSGGFAVGADIKEFAGYADSGQVLDAIENGQRVFEHLARVPCPSVAAIHGHCLGGGVELALACRYRVASRDPDTRLGLPEVQLGIHPGWGGTARLPGLIGAPQALELMLTGRTVSAQRAATLGLVDALAAPDGLLESARSIIRRAPARALPRRALAAAGNAWPARQILAALVRKQTAARVRPAQYPAPFALIEVWRRGGSRIAQRLKLEARSVAKLAETPTCRNLIRVFFLKERLDGLAGAAAHGIARVHVVGAGIMGGDIAAWCALNGFAVTLQDRDAGIVQPALVRAGELFSRKLKTPERIDPVRARLRADVEGTGIADADLVIEAIFENPDAKQALYREIEPRMKADALLATNTSSIPLGELRAALLRPGRFLGLHYFNPVAQMPLVEVVRHDALEGGVETRALAFCKAIDKLPLPVAGTPGFLVNRVLMPYLLEAMHLHNEGVPGPVLDRAATGFGMPMGPIELADTVGLDVCASVARELGPFLGLELPPGLEAKLESKQRGRKDGQGFYHWTGGKPVKPEVPKDHVASDDLEDRLILPMLNEAVACLHDGVVDDADLLDAGVIFGTGFAPFRGGPIRYIRDTGAEALRERLTALARKYGERFRPRPGWDLAALTTKPPAEADR